VREWERGRERNKEWGEKLLQKGGEIGRESEGREREGKEERGRARGRSRKEKERGRERDRKKLNNNKMTQGPTIICTLAQLVLNRCFQNFDVKVKMVLDTNLMNIKIWRQKNRLTQKSTKRQRGWKTERQKDR
jgi:hypothetical protein